MDLARKLRPIAARRKKCALDPAANRIIEDIKTKATRDILLKEEASRVKSQVRDACKGWL